MYNLNRLMRNVLITPHEVMFHAPTKQVIDERVIEQSIIIAEERFTRPEIGFTLYDTLVNAKNTIITAGNIAANQILIGAQPVLVVGDIINGFELMTAQYQALWKQHLWKLTAECVIAAAFPDGFVEFGSQGVMHNSPPAGLMVTSGVVSPLLGSVKWMLDKKIQDRIGPLLESMHNYLCLNISDYTGLYTRECPDCDDKPKTKWSGLALNVYDDPEDDCNCNREPGWINRWY